MKILMYCNWGTYKDEDGVIWLPSIHATYLRSLKRLGYTKIILLSKVYTSRPDSCDSRLQNEGIEVCALPFFRSSLHALTFFLPILKAFKSVSRHEYDSVYMRVYEPFGWLLALLLLKRNSGRIFMHYISDPKTAIYSNRNRNKIKNTLIYLAFLPEYLLTTAVSLKTGINVSSNGPVPRSRVPKRLREKMHPVIETALDDEQFSEAKGSWIQTNQVITRNVNFLYVGYLRASKGIFGILESFRKLCESEPNFAGVMHLVGEGEERATLERYVAAHRLGRYVVFHGYCPFGPELFKIYLESDIFVNFSPSETGPRVVLEAAEFNCRVITNDVGYCRLLESDFDSFYVTSSYSIEELTSIMHEQYQQVIELKEESNYDKVKDRRNDDSTLKYSVDRFFGDVFSNKQ